VKPPRRAFATALVVAVLLTGLPFLPIPILTCPVCAGVALRALEPGFPRARARTGCPCCRDRGRATALQAFRHRNVPRFLREAIQEPLRSAEPRLRHGMLSSPGEDEAIETERRSIASRVSARPGGGASSRRSSRIPLPTAPS
jgi:hypothetical protein